jgi:hypothetical protein
LEKRGKRYRAEKPRQELSREKYEIGRVYSFIGDVQILRAVASMLLKTEIKTVRPQDCGRIRLSPKLKRHTPALLRSLVGGLAGSQIHFVVSSMRHRYGFLEPPARHIRCGC